jgi:hypothetical protein
MEATFFQKIIIAVVLGLVAAGGVKFYDTFVVDANEAVNGGYQLRNSVPQ